MCLCVWRRGLLGVRLPAPVISISQTPDLGEDEAPCQNMYRLTGWPVWGEPFPRMQHCCQCFTLVTNITGNTARIHILIFLFWRFPCVVVTWRDWSVFFCVDLWASVCKYVPLRVCLVTASASSLVFVLYYIIIYLHLLQSLKIFCFVCFR